MFSHWSAKWPMAVSILRSKISEGRGSVQYKVQALLTGASAHEVGEKPLVGGFLQIRVRCTPRLKGYHWASVCVE